MSIARKNGTVQDTSYSFMTNFLWGTAAIVSSANTEIRPDASGITVSIRVQDILLMLAVTYLLGRGLRTNNYVLVLPWIILSTWNMYHVHYANFLKMGMVLRQRNLLGKLPWVALLFDLLGLLMRIVLITRVAHVALKQWAKRQLEIVLQKKSLKNKRV